MTSPDSFMDALNAKVSTMIYLLTLFFCINFEGGMGEITSHTPKAYHSLNMGAPVFLNTGLILQTQLIDTCQSSRVNFPYVENLPCLRMTSMHDYVITHTSPNYTTHNTHNCLLKYFIKNYYFLQAPLPPPDRSGAALREEREREKKMNLPGGQCCF